MYNHIWGVAGVKGEFSEVDGQVDIFWKFILDGQIEIGFIYVRGRGMTKSAAITGY
jgi:hypothetical protein